MYESYYGFEKQPFSISPDPDFLYLNGNYREALALLQFGVYERKGIVALIGEVGTGKTMLVNELLGSLQERAEIIVVPLGTYSFEGLARYLLNRLGATESEADAVNVDALRRLLLERAERDLITAVLVDEAQNLKAATLENLRLLSNLETTKEKLLQIILVGQPELKERLSRPELRQFRQRIAVTYTLKSLARDEIARYVAHRLRAAGYKHGLQLFTERALDQISAYSEGIPRLVNALCDNGLLLGFANGKHIIDGELIQEAAGDLMLGPGPIAPSRPAIGSRSSTSRDAPAGGRHRPAAPPWGAILGWAFAIGLVLVVVAVPQIGSYLRGLVGNLGAALESGWSSVTDTREASVNAASEPDGGAAAIAAQRTTSTADSLAEVASVEYSNDNGADSTALTVDPDTKEGGARRREAPLSGVADPRSSAEPVARIAQWPTLDSTNKPFHGTISASTGTGGTYPEVATSTSPQASQGVVETLGEVDVDRRSQGAELGRASAAATTTSVSDDPGLSIVTLRQGSVYRDPVGGHTPVSENGPDETLSRGGGDRLAMVAVGEQARMPEPEDADELAQTIAMARRETYAAPQTEPAPGMNSTEPGPVIEPVSISESGLAGRGQNADLAEAATSAGVRRRVQSGQTLTGIAREVYGQAGWYELGAIALSNPSIRALDLIYLGQEIYLPSLEDGAFVFPSEDSEYGMLLGVTLSSSNAAQWLARLEEELAVRKHNARVAMSSSKLSSTTDMYLLEVVGFPNRTAAQQGIDDLKPLRELIGSSGEVRP